MQSVVDKVGKAPASPTYPGTTTVGSVIQVKVQSVAAIARFDVSIAKLGGAAAMVEYVPPTPVIKAP